MKIRIKHILRCYQSGMSIRSISSSLLISRNTVKRYIRIYEDMGIELERLLKMDEQHLHELFGVDIDNASARSAEYKYLEEHIPEYIKRLKSRGTTRRFLYEEYLKNRPQGYSYCSFCLYLRREREVKVPVGRIDHIAGDQMYVDFAGDKLYLSEEKTGDKVPVEVFAAILPCSQITYYEAVPSQKKEYLIQACENAFHYFGGVPNAIVPDNLKSAVTKPGGIEPVINDDFAAFADHYGCVVFPARVRKPKDKALVENAVRLLYREVYSKMMGLKFNDLEALNIEIVKHTDALNSRKMYNRSYSRRERFLEVEKDRLHTLPATRFISKNRKTATVMRNSYVSLNNHYYSVPKEYIGDTVELLYDGDTVEIYHKFRHITTHRRDDTPFTYSEKRKSYLASAIGYEACKNGVKTLYSNASKLMGHLKMAKNKGTIESEMKKIEKCPLLILDDLFLIGLDAKERSILMEIIEDRHGLKSIIITSQLPVESWYDAIGDPTVADAILDRIVHSAHKIELTGDSVRKINTKKK